LPLVGNQVLEVRRIPLVSGALPGRARSTAGFQKSSVSSFEQKEAATQRERTGAKRHESRQQFLDAEGLDHIIVRSGI